MTKAMYTKYEPYSEKRVAPSSSPLEYVYTGPSDRRQEPRRGLTEVRIKQDADAAAGYAEGGQNPPDLGYLGGHQEDGSPVECEHIAGDQLQVDQNGQRDGGQHQNSADVSAGEAFRGCGRTL
jgi:hypothetical protein